MAPQKRKPPNYRAAPLDEQALPGKFARVKRSGDGWSARCPSHDDSENSLSITPQSDRWLIHCHAGCPVEKIVAAVGLTLADLFYEKRSKSKPPPSGGFTLAKYSELTKLPVEFLKACGVAEIYINGVPVVRIPYFGPEGELLAVRHRIAAEGDRFRWKEKGTKPHLYGINWLDEARKAGEIVVVEGESDVHVLRFNGVPTIGTPGAGNWREDRDAKHLDGIESILVVDEGGQGGKAMKAWLRRSIIRHRVKVVSLPTETKDPRALFVADSAAFKQRWQLACMAAVPWTAIERAEQAEERSEAWEACRDLAQRPDILTEFAHDLVRLGLVGETRTAQLVFMALVSRLLRGSPGCRPVSVIIKGISSAGKSFTVETTLRFFPGAAFYQLTGMSERALIFDDESFEHRMLVIAEAAALGPTKQGAEGSLLPYLLRELLSSGCLRYTVVEKTPRGLVSRTIVKPGPTGAILTSTRYRLDAELENRLLTLGIADSPQQTRAVLRALAEEAEREIDLSRWHALDTWISAGPREVTIPYGPRLAALIQPKAVRLRRDFSVVLSLIRAHALLHQATRETDEQGRVVATEADYVAIRELTNDLLGQGLALTVKPETRETVEAVKALIAEGKAEVTQADLAAALRLDKSTVSTRVGAAIVAGYLRNNEERRGRPSRLVLGDPLPADEEVLPSVEWLVGWRVARGVYDPPSPPSQGNGADPSEEIPFP